MAGDVKVTVEGADAIDARLTAYGTMLRDFAPFLRLELAQLRAGTKQRFDTQGGDVGGWKPLSPAYAAWKARRYPGMPILVATGELRHSLVDEGGFGAIEEVSSMGLTYGTQVPYARYHQFGTGRMPARPVLAMDEAARQGMGERLTMYMKRAVEGAS